MVRRCCPPDSLMSVFSLFCFFLVVPTKRLREVMMYRRSSPDHPSAVEASHVKLQRRRVPQLCLQQGHQVAVRLLLREALDGVLRQVEELRRLVVGIEPEEHEVGEVVERTALFVDGELRVHHEAMKRAWRPVKRCPWDRSSRLSSVSVPDNSPLATSKIAHHRAASSVS